MLCCVPARESGILPCPLQLPLDCPLDVEDGPASTPRLKGAWAGAEATSSESLAATSLHDGVAPLRERLCATSVRSFSRSIRGVSTCPRSLQSMRVVALCRVFFVVCKASKGSYLVYICVYSLWRNYVVYMKEDISRSFWWAASADTFVHTSIYPSTTPMPACSFAHVNMVYAPYGHQQPYTYTRRLVGCFAASCVSSWGGAPRVEGAVIHPGRADDRSLPSPRCRASLGVV